MQYDVKQTFSPKKTAYFSLPKRSWSYRESDHTIRAICSTAFVVATGDLSPANYSLMDRLAERITALSGFSMPCLHSRRLTQTR